jgi:hypothetical protein
MQFRHEPNVSRGAFVTAQITYLELQPQALVAWLEHILLTLTSMPHKHGYQNGITSSPFELFAVSCPGSVVAGSGKLDRFNVTAMLCANF